MQETHLFQQTISLEASIELLDDRTPRAAIDRNTDLLLELEQWERHGQQAGPSRAGMRLQNEGL